MVCQNSQDILVSFLLSSKYEHLISEEENIFDSEDFIPLFVKEKIRLYKAWEKALIIKVFGKKNRVHISLYKIAKSMETY